MNTLKLKYINLSQSKQTKKPLTAIIKVTNLVKTAR